MSDPPKKRKTIDEICEYNEAKRRFKGTESDSQDKSSNCSNFCDDITTLDDLIAKIYNGDTADLEIGVDSTDFYKMIHHSDYKQIKRECMEKFYTEVCNTFILSHLINDIIKNLNELDSIAHVKTYIAQALFMVLQVEPILENGLLILKYSKTKRWHVINLNRIHSIRISPCAYKVMLFNEKFRITHLNFLFQMFQVKELTLSGCNLNGRNTQDLLHGLELNSLELSKCGTSVNEFIQNNAAGALKNLKHLDISNNPVCNETLEYIRHIPLADLNISNSIKTSGRFINSIWFTKTYGNPHEKKDEDAEGNIGILWNEGVSRENIKVLNVSFNNINSENLERISKLQLEELDITEDSKDEHFARLPLPNNLKVLKAQGKFVNFSILQELCRFPLCKLEFNYSETQNADFSGLLNSPLANNLTELTLLLKGYDEQFKYFISKLKLKYFDYCKCDPLFINPFLSDFPEERTYLKVLVLEVISSYFKFDGMNQFVSGLKNLDLEEFRIQLYGEHVKFIQILSLENLQNSVSKLKLTGMFIQDADLIGTTKFKKLEELAFCFDHRISEEALKMVVEMTTLKELEVEAIFRSKLTLKMARCLCIASIKRLKLWNVVNTDISAETLNYLSQCEIFFQFSKNLTELELNWSTIPSNFAKILSNCKLETILSERSDMGTLNLIFENENIIPTLEKVKLKESIESCHLISKAMAKLCLSEFELPINIYSDDKISFLLKSTSILKFLRVLSYNCNITTNKTQVLLLQSNISQVHIHVNE